jgi:hypothetical protein
LHLKCAILILRIACKWANLHRYTTGSARLAARRGCVQALEVRLYELNSVRPI